MKDTERRGLRRGDVLVFALIRTAREDAARDYFERYLQGEYVVI